MSYSSMIYLFFIHIFFRSFNVLRYRGENSKEYNKLTHHLNHPVSLHLIAELACTGLVCIWCQLFLGEWEVDHDWYALYMSQCHQQPMGTALCGFYVARHMDIMMERVHSPKSSSCVCENPSIIMLYVFHTCSGLVHDQLLICYYVGTANRHKGIVGGEARSTPPGCCHLSCYTCDPRHWRVPQHVKWQSSYADVVTNLPCYVCHLGWQ